MSKINLKQCFMGVDLGTGGARVAFYDINGNALAKASKDYQTYYPKSGFAEQKPQDWWDALKEASKEAIACIKEPIVVETILLGATSSTVLMLDKKYQPLDKAILWMDSRAVSQAEKFNATKDDILNYSGGSVSVEWMGPKSLWLQEYSPYYQEAAFICEQLDYINYRLTNRLVASKCNASCKWNYVDIEGGFKEEFFSKIGLEAFYKWPKDVIATGDYIADLTKEAANELGLPNRPKLLQGAIDAHVSMFGLGAFEPGKLVMIMGSSFVYLTLSKELIYNQSIWGPYPNALADGYNLLEAGQISAGSIINWFRELTGSNLSYEQLSCDAAKIAPGAEGLMVLDFWQGNRTPLKNADLKGAILGLRLHHTKAHIFRALLEAVAYGCRNTLESLELSSGKIESMILGGGPTNSNLWMQIIADITKKEVFIPEDSDGVLLGGAILGALYCGVYNSYQEAIKKMIRPGKHFIPSLENNKIYDEKFNSYKKSILSISPLLINDL